MQEWREIQDQREKYQAYLCSREWAVLKQAVHQRGDGVCERCGQYPIDAVHHLTYARQFAEKLEDLQGWCKHCHGYVHGTALWDPREDQVRVPMIDGVETPMSIHDVLVDTFAQIDHRNEHGGPTGVPTGFSDLDKLTGGLHEGELSILAARPSMGKTALATNIADYCSAEADVPTLLVTLEMTRGELAQRMLCARGKIDGRKFRSGFLAGSDREPLVRAAAELSKAPLFLDDTSSRSVAEIAALVRRLSERRKLGVVVIDYLQLIQPDNSKDPRHEQVAKISRKLKGLARELNVAVLCLAQLNRQAEVSRDNRPKLWHLRESGAIEQDADVVMFVHREEYYHTAEEAREMDLVGKAELILAKQRNGPIDEVRLAWRPEFIRFENRTRESSDEFSHYNGGDF